MRLSEPERPAVEEFPSMLAAQSGPTGATTSADAVEFVAESEEFVVVVVIGGGSGGGGGGGTIGEVLGGIGGGRGLICDIMLCLGLESCWDRKGLLFGVGLNV